MTYTLETIELGKYTIEIQQDDCSVSPREWDNLGTITAWHRNYNLSDEKHNYDIDDFINEVVNDKDIISLPVYMYEHGGVTLNTDGFSCSWDSGQVGWIHVSKDKIRKEYGVKRITQKTLDKVYKLLTDEINTYSQYINGDVYTYVIVDAQGDIIDSCSGFYGLEYVESEARSMVDYLNDKGKKERTEKLKTLIKNHTPLNIRLNILK